MSRDNAHETGEGVRFVAEICCGHWVLRVVISHTRQGVRFCDRHLVLRVVVSPPRQNYDLLQALGAVFCYDFSGIGLCLLSYHIHAI